MINKVNAIIILMFIIGCAKNNCIKYVSSLVHVANNYCHNPIMFHEIVERYENSSSLVIYFDSEGCLYLNQNFEIFKLQFYNYLKEKSDYEVVLLFSEKFSNFNQLEDVYNSIREAYMRIWSEMSFEYFGVKNLADLNYFQANKIWVDFPAKNVIRLDYLSNERRNEIFHYMTTMLMPINPLAPSEESKGLLPE
jgi:hypothetical protein